MHTSHIHCQRAAEIMRRKVTKLSLSGCMCVYSQILSAVTHRRPRLWRGDSPATAQEACASPGNAKSSFENEFSQTTISRTGL